MRLKDKVALISGAARGMGAVEARLFAAEGAKVVLGDTREEEGKRVEEEISAQGGQAVFMNLDVTREEDWRRAVVGAEARYGKLDVLVNNAGITGVGSIETLSLEDWHRVMDVNCTGVFLGCKHAIPAMRRAGGGSIINISSQLGFVGSEGSDPSYQASKGAVRILTKHVAVRYAKENIRCNSVHPGPIDTPMTIDRRRDQVFLAKLLSKIPMGRVGEPEEVAWAVLYLASDEASYVTGAELSVDGGWIAQ